MKLSILDQMPIFKGEQPADALNAAVDLAKLGETYGYERYWVAEHHSMSGLACPAPDTMLAIIGQHTTSIRIGSGAVLLPHYKPYHVVERYHLLATLYPNRIDLGIGRAPGASAEATQALNDNFLQQVKEFPDQVTELLQFLEGSFPEGHTFAKAVPTPVPDFEPVPWLLGTSEKSAQLAAKKGMNYAFGHFMTDKNGPIIVDTYRKQFVSSQPDAVPRVIVAVSVVCAGTNKHAHNLAEDMVIRSLEKTQGRAIHSDVMSEGDQVMFDQAIEQIIIGTPEEVRHQLETLNKFYKADEYMVVTNIPNRDARRQSYKCLIEAFNKKERH